MPVSTRGKREADHVDIEGGATRKKVLLLAAKRRKDENASMTTANPDPSSKASRPSRLESLPAEILEKIFITSLNGSLLRAAPRIARKFSGSNVLKRCVFLMAFYARDIEKMRRYFKFDHLLLDDNVQIGCWEKRSLIKAVLGSRWCTFGWLRALHRDLVGFAWWVFCNEYAKQPFDLADLEGLEGASHSPGSSPTDDDAWKPVNLFGAEITNPSTERDYQLGVTGPFDFFIFSGDEDDAWRSEMEGFGLLLHEDFSWENYVEDKHFRHIFEDTVAGFPPISGESLVFKTTYDHARSTLTSAVKQGNSIAIRSAIEIAYFFHPEELPFKLDSQLFIIAAMDHNADAMIRLFAADPSSLPREHPQISAWLSSAKKKLEEWLLTIRDTRIDWYQQHWDMIDDQEHDPMATCGLSISEHRTKILRPAAEAKELINVIRYIADGTERPSSSHPDLESLYPIETSSNCDCGYKFDMKFSTPIWNSEEFGESDILPDTGIGDFQSEPEPDDTSSWQEAAVAQDAEARLLVTLEIIRRHFYRTGENLLAGLSGEIFRARQEGSGGG